jgi:16S rRNA processing protein RimM
MLADADALVVGKVVAAHGIKGWVKVLSFTDPKENIFDYQPWYLKTDKGWAPVKLTGGRVQGKGLVAQLDGETDRNVAEARFLGREIAIPRAVLPTLEDGDYYWRDLIGLRVRTDAGEDLGKVTSLMETGANDVLVVRGDSHSLDRQERLIPWVPDEFVTEVNLGEGYLVVDWDPAF